MTESQLRIQWVLDGVYQDDTGAFNSSLASNRYRMLCVYEWARNQNMPVSVVSMRSWDARDQTIGQCDLVIVGKLIPGGDQDQILATGDRVLEQVRLVRAAGIRVVADFNDDHFLRKGVGPYWQAMARLADLCVAGTPQMAERLQLFTSVPTQVIGDPVLTPRREPRVVKPVVAKGWRRWLGRAERSFEPLRLLWFGNLVNWPPVMPWAERLLALGTAYPWRLTVVTTPAEEVRKAVDAFNRKAGNTCGIDLVAWSVSEQEARMAQAHIVLLPSAPELGAKVVKTANRLLEAVWSGCVVIASDLPAYCAYKDRIFLVSDPLEGLTAYMRDTAAAKDEVARLQLEIAQTLTVERVSGVWLAAVSRLMADRRKDCQAFNRSRVLVLAPSLIPTVQIAWLAPLRALAQEDRCEVALITEEDVEWRIKSTGVTPCRQWLLSWLSEWQPDVIVLCRYGGVFGPEIHAWIDSRGGRLIYSIDDDLFDIPVALGAKKISYHMDPKRLQRIKLMMESADEVDCSSGELKLRLESKGLALKLISYRNFCAGTILPRTRASDGVMIGYFGFDHERDFAMAVPGLYHALDCHQNVTVELMVPFEVPMELQEFGERVVVLSTVGDYNYFMKTIAGRGWDIGLCPLEKNSFNRVKNINKWIELTSVGACVLASAGSIYDECCGGDSGELVDDDGWKESLERVIDSPEYRRRLVENAQRKLLAQYDIGRQTEQVATLISQ